MNLHDRVQIALCGGPPVEYPGDCDRICTVARGQGVLITPAQAQRIWRERSDSASAGWLMVDSYSDEEILWAIEAFANRAEEHNS